MDPNEDQNNNTSLSWERSMSSNASSMSANNDQLFLFGYSCKLFRDDQKAKEIDSGKHLIPWMNNESLLIDRFDVRGYLNDIKQHESNKNAFEELTPQELELERLCDTERYADLEDANDHEEELKRLHLALADGASYNEMHYNYENNSSTANEAVQSLPATKEAEVETNDCFKIPSGLTLPEGTTLPDSQKLHNIIEKTAYFVSQHGPQMEIIVKAKQSSNSNFHFLSFDSPLNPYYRVLLSNIKSGKYIPKQTEKTEKSDSDDGDSDDDEHYLHPSLLSSGKNQSKSNIPIVIPNLLRFSDTAHDSYSQLVKSLKDKLTDNETEKPDKSHEQIDKTCASTIEKTDTEEKIVTAVTQPTWSSILPSPPPEIEVIIEKLAQHVAKNGDDFELSIRKREETRFEFVNPGNIYHAHYIRRKLHYLEENRKAQAAKIKHMKTLSKSDSHAPKAPVSFSIGLKESTKSSQSSHHDESSATTVSKRETERASNSEVSSKRNSNTALKDKLAYAARDRVAREKQLQEERKRKAAAFLSMIKKRSKESAKQDNSDTASLKTNNVVGPELPKSSILNQQLSPTIVAVTSPPNSPDSINKNDDNLRQSDYSNINLDSNKTGAILPFIASDKPLKESSSRHSSPHRHHHHRYKKSSHKTRKRTPSPKEKSKSSSKSRSPSCSRSPSHKKYKRNSKSRSRSRSRSHSRSHKKH